MKNNDTLLSNKLFALSLLSCVVSALAGGNTAMAAPPITVRASVSSNEIEGNNSCGGPVLSASGRFVAFASYATNLVPRDRNGRSDIFIRDLKSGVTKRVSLGRIGAESNSDSLDPALSANGRFVAFSSLANNLVRDDNNGKEDIFVRDLATGVTQRVSVDSSGIEGNGASSYPGLSADGRFVAFYSNASNLVENDNNNSYDVFVHDLKTGVTQRVSVDSLGTEAEGTPFSITFPSLSADGRFVAFHSLASNLVVGDNNGTTDVFVRDLQTGITQRVSLDSMGIEGNSTSFDPSLSGDGRFVAFESSSLLVPEDSNGFRDIYVRDLQTGITQRVSLDSTGVEGNGGSYATEISANGKVVTFYSDSSNLVPGDNNNSFDVFTHDLETGVTQRMSLNNLGTEGNGSSYDPAISANGSFVTFVSQASNLVINDKNNMSDIFIRRQ